MNILNETPQTMRIRKQMIFRLSEELQNAVPTLKEDTLYKMFTGSSRTIMTFDYWTNWISLEELKQTLEAVREENNKDKF